MQHLYILSSVYPLAATLRRVTQLSGAFLCRMLDTHFRECGLPRTPVNSRSYCGWHDSVPSYGVGSPVRRELTTWMSKQGMSTERTHGTAATPTSPMWAAGAASWHGSS